MCVAAQRRCAHTWIHWVEENSENTLCIIAGVCLQCAARHLANVYAFGLGFCLFVSNAVHHLYNNCVKLELSSVVRLPPPPLSQRHHRHRHRRHRRTLLTTTTEEFNEFLISFRIRAEGIIIPFYMYSIPIPTI